MGKRFFWGNDSRRVVIRKAVVTCDGQVVPKNYVKASLHRGDFGIHLRFDRTQVEHMTEEQRLAAANAFALMVNDLAAVLGVPGNFGENSK